jgi:hypothetical protein
MSNFLHERLIMQTYPKAPPVSLQLPFEVRMALARAAQTPVSGANPLARVNAVDDAMANARAAFPQLFRE